MVNNLRVLWSALDDNGVRHHLFAPSEFLHYEVALAGGTSTFLFAKTDSIAKLPGYADYIKYATPLAVEKLEAMRTVDVMKTGTRTTICIDKKLVAGGVAGLDAGIEASGYQRNDFIYPTTFESTGDYTDPEVRSRVYREAGANFIAVNGGQVLGSIKLDETAELGDHLDLLRPTLQPYEMYVLCGYGLTNGTNLTWALKTQIGRDPLFKFTFYTGTVTNWSTNNGDKSRCKLLLRDGGLTFTRRTHEMWEGTTSGEKYVWLNPMSALTGFELSFDVIDVVDRPTEDGYYSINKATYKGRTTYERMEQAGLYQGDATGSFTFVARTEPWTVSADLVNEIDSYKKLMVLYDDECVEIDHPDDHKWIVPALTFGEIKAIIDKNGKMGYYLVSDERANQIAAGTTPVGTSDFAYDGYKFRYGGAQGDFVYKDSEQVVIQRNTTLWLQCYMKLPSEPFSWSSTSGIYSWCHSPHPYFVYQDMCEEAVHPGGERCCEWTPPMTDPQFTQWRILLEGIGGEAGYKSDVGNAQSMRWVDMTPEGKVLSYMFTYRSGIIIPRLFLPLYKAHDASTETSLTA